MCIYICIIKYSFYVHRDEGTWYIVQNLSFYCTVYTFNSFRIKEIQRNKLDSFAYTDDKLSPCWFWLLYWICKLCQNIGSHQPLPLGPVSSYVKLVWKKGRVRKVHSWDFLSAFDLSNSQDVLSPWLQITNSLVI